MTHSKRRVAPSVRLLRWLYLVGVICFALGVVLQVFFAGAALLVNPDYLNTHRILGNTVALLPVPMLILAMLARMPHRTTLLTVLLTLVTALQYAFLWGVTDIGLPVWFRAFHAVNAIVMFVLAERLARTSWKLLRGPQVE